MMQDVSWHGCFAQQLREIKMNKFKSVENIIKLMSEKKGVPSHVETDPNDQISVGSYQTKAFEISRPAQKLYSSLPKDTNPDAAQAAATNLDKLFDINKTVKAAGRASQTDIDNATALGDKVKDSAKEMGLETEHDSIVNTHIDNIKKHLTSDNDRVSAKADYYPSDDGRFKSPPKEYTPEGPRNDRDVDNVKKYLINRSKAAQRKLKITDGD